MADTPAGWYPDPDDPTQLRYFDGAAWTEQRAAITPAPAEPTAPPSPPPASPGPETVTQPEQGNSRKQTLLGLVTIGVVALLIFAGCMAILGDDDEPADAGGTPAATTSSPDSPEPKTTTTPPVMPDPSAKYSSSCDYLLGDFTSNTKTGYRFVAGARVKNDGNIGIVLEMRSKWFRLGAKPITDVKEFKLNIGQARRVDVSVPVGQDDIDMHQALGFDEKTCTVRVGIVDTFGTTG